MASKTDGTGSGDVCPHKIAFLFDNWLRRVFQNPQKIVGDYLQEGDTVIDIGCGPGYFAVDMAKMVGKSGKVFAADLQMQMLEKAKKKASRQNLRDRMEFHQCQPSSIGLKQKADFILAFYVVHETPSAKKFLKEVREMLRPHGKLLVVEPKMHVSRQTFEEMLADAKSAGLKIADRPKGKGGRSVLLVP